MSEPSPAVQDEARGALSPPFVSPVALLLVVLLAFLAGAITAKAMGQVASQPVDPCSMNAEDVHNAGSVGTDLHGADLTNARLAGANLCGADLRGAALTRACLRGAHLDGSDLTGAILTGADMSGATVKGAVGAPAKLPESPDACSATS